MSGGNWVSYGVNPVSYGGSPERRERQPEYTWREPCRSPQESQPGPGMTGGAGRAARPLVPPSPSAGSVPLSSVPPPQSDGCVRTAAAPFSGAALPGLLAVTCPSMAGKQGPKHPARSSCSLWVTAHPKHLRPGSVSTAPHTDKPHLSASEKPACSRCDPSPS